MNLIRTSLLAATLCVGLAGAAAAAPLGGVGDTGAAINSEATKDLAPVHSRRCWWHRGHLHCARPQVYGFYWGAPRRHWSWGGFRRW